MKNLSIFSKHFWPENFKINEIALKLKKKFRVNVYTSQQAYNNQKYKMNLKNLKNRKLHGINITYFSSFVRKKDSFFNIFLDYISYVINLTVKINFYLKRETDVCFTYATSPIFQSIPAIYYSKIKKVPNVIWVQDLWPEVLEDTGYIKNKFILNLVDRLVNIIYQNSDLILAQSESFEKHLKKKYKLKNKVFTLYQPADYSFQKFNFKKSKYFYITYAGNFGKAQDFKTILNAFKSNEINENIKLNLIGSGKKFNYLKDEIKKNKLNSKIILSSFKNKNKINKILKSSSAFFISLNYGKSLNKTIPGKFQTYISYGKPILICSYSELNNFIVKNNLGLACKPNDTKKLIYNINRTFNMKEYQKKKIYFLSKNIYEQLFEINKVTKKLETYLYMAKTKYVKKNLL